MLKIREKIKSVCFILPLLMLCSCVSVSADGTSNFAGNSSDNSWIFNPYVKYSENEYLAAVGSGANLQNAQNAASAALTRIIKQNIESNITTNDSDYGTYSDSYYSERVNAWSSIDSLVGVSSDDVFVDKKTNTFYVLSKLNKREASSYYTKKVNENLSNIETLKKKASDASPSIESVVFLNKSLSFAKENENYYDILNVVNASSISARANAAASSSAKQENTRFEIENLRKAEAQKIYIGIVVEGDSDGRVGLALSEIYTSMGFVSKVYKSENQVKEKYLLSGSLTLSDMPSQNKYFYVRYVFNSNLSEKATGKTIFPFSFSGKEAHLTQSEVYQRAIRTVASDLSKKYEKSFYDTLK